MVGSRIWKAYSALSPGMKKIKEQPRSRPFNEFEENNFKISVNYPDPFKDPFRKIKKINSKTAKKTKGGKGKMPAKVSIRFKYLGSIKAGTKEMALIDLGNKQVYLNKGDSIGPWRIKNLTDQFLWVTTRDETKKIKMQKIKN
jgi:Tfp pilus assembly protein PilP